MGQRSVLLRERHALRTSAGIAALRAGGKKITAESLKETTRELEPGFAGLSFQVIRRNPRAYELYCAAADAFTEQPRADQPLRAKRRRRRVRGGSGRIPRSAYDQLQRFDKKELVQRIRSLEVELDAERRRRGALAYDEQALLAKMIRLETEIILLQAERLHPD
jgi:hypothetical protein